MPPFKGRFDTVVKVKSCPSLDLYIVQYLHDKHYAIICRDEIIATYDPNEYNAACKEYLDAIEKAVFDNTKEGEQDSGSAPEDVHEIR